MSVTVSVQQPRAFTREALLLIGGGLVSGMVASVLNVVAGAPHTALAALSFGAVIGLGANLADGREGTPMYRLVLSILGGVLMALLLSVNVWIAAAVGGALIGSALLVGEDLGTLEKAGAALMYGVAMLAAGFAASVLIPQFFQHLSPVGLVFQGGVWGIFMGFASGLRRLDWNRDEVLSEFREAEADLDGEEAGQADLGVLAGRQLTDDGVGESLQHGVGILLGHTGLVGEGGHELAAVHRVLLEFGGRGDRAPR